jgi:hypothetical protein
MALIVPSYPNPCDPNIPITNAYAWGSAAYFDLARGAGSLTLNINPNAEAWQGRPLDQIAVYFGDDLKGPEPMLSLAELMADPDFAAAFTMVVAKLYEAIKAAHPLLQDATIVP